jgi:hypothetical protein
MRTILIYCDCLSVLYPFSPESLPLFMVLRKEQPWIDGTVVWNIWENMLKCLDVWVSQCVVLSTRASSKWMDICAGSVLQIHYQLQVGKTMDYWAYQETFWCGMAGTCGNITMDSHMARNTLRSTMRCMRWTMKFDINLEWDLRASPHDIIISLVVSVKISWQCLSLIAFDGPT